jgi:hypothetical protein
LSAAAVIVFGAVFLFHDRFAPNEFEPRILIRESIAVTEKNGGKGPEISRSRGGKGPEKGGEADIRLSLHIQRTDTARTEQISLENRTVRDINISPEDNFRISVETAGERYLYVCQSDGDNSIHMLFPDESSLYGNPLSSGATYYLPGPSTWYYLVERGDTPIIHISLFTERQDDLIALYEGYYNSGNTEEKTVIGERIRTLLTSVESDGSERYTIRINR